MNCLIVAATPIEITPFLGYFKSSNIKNIDVLITGIGLTATTYSLMRQLRLNKPDLVIQAGVGYLQIVFHSEKILYYRMIFI